MAAFFPQMAEVARQVCMASGQGHIVNSDGAQQISRDHFAPDAADAIHRGLAPPTHSKRTDRATDVYLFEFEVRRKAAVMMAMGGAFPEVFVSILRMRNAASSKREKSAVLASIKATLAFCCGGETDAPTLRILWRRSSSGSFGCFGRGQVLGGWE